MWINLLKSYSIIALCAFILDNVFGSIKFKYHPIILIGKYITFFERHFYKDSIARGALVFASSISLSLVSVLIIYILTPTIYWYVFEIMLSSILLANKMLYSEVKKVVLSDNPRQQLKYLVSRDVDNLSQSDIYKASIETYAENINDAVIAPLFYLLLFGIWGMVFYKCTNTLDSMIGYRNARYERFGKISAKADDVLNYIPARLTAILILLINKKLKYLKNIIKLSSYYPSINAVYPIGAFAYSLEVCLGGPTMYFGKIVFKPVLGFNKCALDRNDVFRALNQKIKIDAFLFSILVLCVFIGNWRIFL